MPEDAPGGLGAADADPSPGGRLGMGLGGGGVLLGEAQRLAEGDMHLHRPGDDAVEHVAAGKAHAEVVELLSQRLGQAVEVVVEPGQRPDQVGMAVELGVQGGGVGHLELAKVLLEVGRGDVESLVGDDPALSDGVVVVMAQRDGDERLVVLGQRQAGDPGDQLAGLLEAFRQVLSKGLDGRRVGGMEEAARTDADRVYRAAAEGADDLVAEPLEPQATAHLVRVVPGHRRGALVAEEVGGGQQVDVQAVALQPLAAVHHPAHRLHPGAGRDAEDRLDRRHRTHLVGHRADAADAGHAVDHVLGAAALEQLLEQPGRLEDAQRQRLDPAGRDADVQGALALDPCQDGYMDLAGSRVVTHPCSSSRP